MWIVKRYLIIQRFFVLKVFYMTKNFVVNHKPVEKFNEGSLVIENPLNLYRNNFYMTYYFKHPRRMSGHSWYIFYKLITNTEIK